MSGFIYYCSNCQSPFFPSHIRQTTCDPCKMKGLDIPPILEATPESQGASKEGEGLK